MSCKCKQKSIKLGYILLVILCCGIGYAIGPVCYRYLGIAEKSLGLPLALAIIIAILVAAFFLSIILHEMGHLIFGFISGYRFSSFRIGSLMLIKTGGKLKFTLHSVVGTGGQCLLVPPDIKNGKLPYVMYNLGGIISNLAFTLLSAVLAYVCRDYIYPSTALATLALVNLLFVLSNGIPISSTYIDNDAKNIISIRKNPEVLNAFWLQLKINAALADGVRLSEMPEEWFLLPREESPNNSLIASKYVFHENRLVDLKDFDAAETIIERCKNLPALPGIYKSLLTLDLITIKAIRGNDYAEIAALFTREVHKLMNSMRTFPAVIRTKYVFAMLVEHNPEGAARAHALFEKTAKTYPYTPEIESEREIMEYADSCVLSE